MSRTTISSATIEGGHAVRLVLAAAISAFLLAACAEVKTELTKAALNIDEFLGVERDYDTDSIRADVEAIAVIHHLGNLSGDAPTVSLTIPKDGRLTLVISDPNGLRDLNPLSRRQLNRFLDVERTPAKADISANSFPASSAVPAYSYQTLETHPGVPSPVYLSNR